MSKHPYFIFSEQSRIRDLGTKVEMQHYSLFALHYYKVSTFFLNFRKYNSFRVEPLPKSLSVLESRDLNITCKIVNQTSEVGDINVQ